MTGGTSLYYPYIHPRNVDDLKSALLYWDRVRRIVPPSVREGDHAFGDGRHIRVLTDHGLLVATDPQRYETQAAEKFFSRLGNQPDRFRLGHEAARAIVNSKKGVHAEKIAPLVIQRLRHDGLAHQFGPWVGMHDDVAALYMFCLAAEIGERIGAPLLADSPDDAKFGQALLFHPNGDGEELSEYLMALDIELPSAPQLRDVSLDKLVKFVNRYRDQRRLFRSTVASIIEHGRQLDPFALDDYLDDLRPQIAESVKAARSSFRTLWAGAYDKIARITAPTGIGAVVTALPLSPLVEAVLTTAGLTLSGIALYQETLGKLHEARTDSPYHYLNAVNRTFGAQQRQRKASAKPRIAPRKRTGRPRKS